MKGKFEVNFAGVISEFERAIQKFQVKRILYKTVFRGKGLEFDSYRDFESDDDSGMIDWKASLRGNKLLAKKYVEERDMDIYFFVDVSNSMLFGSGKVLKAEYAAELIASLSHLIMNSGDNVGLVFFSDKIVKVLRPLRDANHFGIETSILSDAAYYGGGFDFNSAVDFALKTIVSPSSMIILVSDFIRMNDKCENHLKLLAARFETIAIMIRDPFDEELPNVKGQMIVQDPYSGNQMLIDPSLIADQYKQNALKHKEKIIRIFRESGVDFFEINTNKSFIIPFVSFLKRRAGGGI